MNARYYSAIVRREDDYVMLPGMRGPFNDSDAVHRYQAGLLAQQDVSVTTLGSAGESKYENRVFLDMNSVGNLVSRNDIRHLLDTDPILHAIFELGRAYGRCEK